MVVIRAIQGQPSLDQVVPSWYRRPLKRYIYVFNHQSTRFVLPLKMQRTAFRDSFQFTFQSFPQFWKIKRAEFVDILAVAVLFSQNLVLF